jgi:large subunit ribosomal protein L25
MNFLENSMSEAIYKLEATVRSDQGKGASRRLRRNNLVPAVLYGSEQEAQTLSLAHNKVWQAQEHEGFYSHILTLVIDGKNQEVILKDVQRHPYKPQILHLDFQRVDASHKIQTKVPVHFINEEAAAKKGGVVTHAATELEITCLPKDLPEFIEVNVGKMEVGQTLHISDLKLPAGVSSVELAKGESHDIAIVTVHAPKGGAVEETAEDAE